MLDSDFGRDLDHGLDEPEGPLEPGAGAGEVGELLESGPGRLLSHCVG